MEERKIGQIKEELKAATEAMLPSFIMAYESDERSLEISYEQITNQM